MQTHTASKQHEKLIYPVYRCLDHAEQFYDLATLTNIVFLKLMFIRVSIIHYVTLCIKTQFI